MKKILVIILTYTALLGQIVEPIPVEITDENQIEAQLYKLQCEIEQQFNEDVKRGFEPKIIKIDRVNAIIEGNKAVTSIEITSSTSNHKEVLVNQEFVFNQANLSELEKYPSSLNTTIYRSKLYKPKVAPKQKSSTPTNITNSESPISIVVNNEVFVPYPIFLFYSGAKNYEININIIKSQYDIQLFSAGAEADACVYYSSYVSEYQYKRVAFYVDPGWNRIVYANETNRVTNSIDGFSGDDNVKLSEPVAIHVNDIGEIFVLDKDQKKVFKLQYVNSTDKITTTPSSTYIESDHFKSPSDLSYFNNDTYNTTEDDFFVITDREDKSVMVFDHNGNLINRYTSYNDTPISDPKKVIVFKDRYTQDKYIAFIDNNRVVKGKIGASVLSNVQISDSFPWGSDLTDIGLVSYGHLLINSLVVTDRNKDMLHHFNDDCKYICSYKGPISHYMSSPVKLYNTTFAHYPRSRRVSLDFFAMDQWSYNRGIKKYVPGAGILNSTITRGTFKWILTYEKTNPGQTTEIELWDMETAELVTNSPYAFDSELVPGREYTWVIKYKPFFDGNYTENNVGWKRKQLSFIHNPTLPTVVNTNCTISGNYSANQNCTVASGITMTVTPGSRITFSNNSSLIVDGKLVCDINPSKSTILDFTTSNSTAQNGIKINQGGWANIANTKIKNAYNGISVTKGNLNIINSQIFGCRTGIYVNEGTTSITNCSIDNGYSGIHLYRTNYSNPARITDCHIYNTNVGIDMYYSGAYIAKTEINNNYIGINTINYSSPYLAPDDYLNASVGRNKIHDNSFGLFVENHSNPWLGRESCINFGGNNAIYSNTTKDINLNDYCTVYAENNYWGGGPTSSYYVGNGCFFDQYPYLNSMPMSKLSSQNPEEEAFDNSFPSDIGNVDTPISLDNTSKEKPGYNEKWPIEWKLLYARNLLRVKRYNAAADICETVITNYPDSARSHLALDLLWQAKRKSKSMVSLQSFVNLRSRSKNKNMLLGAAELILAGNSKANRISFLDNLYSVYKNTKLEESILLDKFMYYLYDVDDLKSANEIFNRIEQSCSKSPSFLYAKRHLDNRLSDSYTPRLGKENTESQLEEIELPDNYQLLGNYPNPFNPSTTISYALPFNSRVELNIYDVTGKLVKSLKLTDQSAGHQSIVWNGTNEQGTLVSSGIYLYRFKAVSLEGNGKVFEKSAKMLLVK